jgi:hypothetical protein
MMWPPHLPTSVRRYNAPIDQTTWEYMQGKRKYIFHQGPPPVRQAPQITPGTQRPRQGAYSKERRAQCRVHWLLIFGALLKDRITSSYGQVYTRAGGHYYQNGKEHSSYVFVAKAKKRMLGLSNKGTVEVGNVERIDKVAVRGREYRTHTGGAGKHCRADRKDQ